MCVYLHMFSYMMEQIPMINDDICSTPKHLNRHKLLMNFPVKQDRQPEQQVSN